EEAARLASALGRDALLTATLINHASLLVSFRAASDARPLLLRGAELAARTKMAFFVAQAVLIDAELEAIASPSIGQARAEEAKALFERAGVARQALEAELLVWELGLEVDEASAHAGALFAEAHEPALAQAGLQARAWLLRARAGAIEERWGGARELAARAARRAEEDRDRLLALRAHRLVATIDDRVGTDPGPARAAADEHVRAIAASLPPGLRERFVADHPRSAPVRASVASSDDGLPPVAQRIVALTRRVLLAGDERAFLNDALDEVIALSGAERAFLLRRTGDRPSDVLVVARNLDGDALRKRRRSFSRSVADRVFETGEVVLTAAAADDPSLRSARSIVDLGVRSILCVPIRAPSGIVGALYLDHRFESARFSEGSREVVQAVADVIGLALENARLHREAERRATELERAHDAVSRENERRAVELERLEGRLASMIGPSDARELEDSGVVGRSPALLAALGLAKRVAKSDLSVLLEGESGTGKELFARAIHARSLRADGPFLAINCGAIPEGVLESELFGHVRGAFTGALRDHPGIFRAAEGGTVFLDEIGEMPARMQTRLLRVLQEREVRPVGAETAVPIDARVLAATNRDLEADAMAGRFRRDLYFRLVGARITLPPLRERPEDVPLLTQHALTRIAAEPGMREVRVSPEGLRALMRHHWPGNVRELEQTLRRAVLVAEADELGPGDLAVSAEPVDRRRAIRAFDRDLVARALRRAKGNRSQAARELGISRMTLYRWMERHGL
ncbi:MAG: sigma 54-interacting transcriptional regulator, partial [Sandaracinaceae bacterium]